MEHLQPLVPFAAKELAELDDIELAVLDQFSARFSKLQDAMGEKLFPAVLDLTKEPGDLAAFVDKLHRLEKIGAIPSAESWLLLREMRNAFSDEVLAKLPSMAVLQDETGKCDFPVSSFSTAYSRRKWRFIPEPLGSCNFARASHDYPDDPELQSAILNKAYELADELLATLAGIDAFAAHYL